MDSNVSHTVSPVNEPELLARAQPFDPGQVKPRRIDPNPRCSACKSPDRVGRAPMAHPQHRWGPCQVRMPDGPECGYTEGVVTTRQPTA